MKKQTQIKYRFFEEKDERGKKQHLHQILRNKGADWENLTGISRISSVISKPLTWWAAGCAVSKLGWINSKIKDDNGRYQTVPLESRLKHLKPRWQEIMRLDDVGIVSLLDEAYRAHSEVLDDTAEQGTDLHAELEEYVKKCIEIGYVTEGFIGAGKKIELFARWAKQNIKRFLWSELHSFDEELGVGGICDAGAELKNGQYAIIDFKSHAEPYFTDYVQTAGYDVVISKNGGYTKNGEKIFNLEKPIERYLIAPFKHKDVGKCLDSQLKYPVDVGLFRQGFVEAFGLLRKKEKFEKF